MRTYEDLLHGLDGIEVTIPGRVAAILETRCSLTELRVSLRGRDPEVDQALMAITLAAHHWRNSATGSSAAPKPEVAPTSKWYSTTEAADLLYCTSRAVRMAITENRLNATRIGRTYRISRDDLEHFRAGRKAA